MGRSARRLRITRSGTVNVDRLFCLTATLLPSRFGLSFGNACVRGSNTTIDTVQPGVADCAPGPRPREKCPSSRCPGVAARRGKAIHTDAGDFAGQVVGQCARPGFRNHAAWRDRQKSNPKVCEGLSTYTISLTLERRKIPKRKIRTAPGTVLLAFLGLQQLHPSVEKKAMDIERQACGHLGNLRV